MKLFKKLIVTAAVMASVASLAVVSANAAEGDDFTASYSDNTITITGLNKSADVSQLSLLVLSEDATDISGDKAAVYTGVADDKGIIVQIDQDETFENKTIKVSLPDGTALPNGTYYVRVGGEAGASAAYKKATFTVGNAEDKTVLVGDANSDGAADGLDAVQVLIYDVAPESSIINAGEDVYYGCAYSNGDAVLDGLDAVQILIYDVSPESSQYVGTTKKVSEIKALETVAE